MFAPQQEEKFYPFQKFAGGMIFGLQAGLESSNKLPQRFFKAFLSLKTNKKIIIKPADKGRYIYQYIESKALL